MQVVPAVAGNVRSLTVFQRSKQWAAPFEQFRKPIPSGARFLLREILSIRNGTGSASPDLQRQDYSSPQIDPDWPIRVARSTRKTRSIGRPSPPTSRRNWLPAGFATDVLPDYLPFGKRMLMDNGWYRTLTHDNVRLVTDGIAEIGTRDRHAFRRATCSRCAGDRDRVRCRQHACVVRALRKRRPVHSRGMGGTRTGGLHGK